MLRRGPALLLWQCWFSPPAGNRAVFPNRVPFSGRVCFRGYLSVEWPIVAGRVNSGSAYDGSG